MGYISQDVLVDELPFHGLFILQKDNVLVLADKPDWVRDPTTGQRLYISSMWVSEVEVACPACGYAGRHGLVTFDESNKFVLACNKCKNFVWLEPRG